LPVSPDFLDYVLEQFEPLGGVTCRRMFGGAGLYRHGVIFGLIAQDVIYLKADDATRRDFAAAGGAAFAPFDGPKMIGYWSIPAEDLEDPDALAAWARKALAVAARAPVKPRRKPRP
jgi:DNA transformation protein